MSHLFRDLLKKVGSGPHTSKDLTREEAAIATRLMLTQEATPAQIGAFMIAHRIKRPTPEELAGMLDAYDVLGPRLTALPNARPMVFGIPYDGRSRTAPVAPVIALLLASVGYPVILHGGDRIPTKYGVPLVELWQGLGVDWQYPTLSQVQHILEETGIGLVYLPHHFPEAQAMVRFRDEIGKRPPFATVELFWCPYAGEAVVVSGYVHPPTEGLVQNTFALRGIQSFITVKGLEGSCDLPRDRTAIIGVQRPHAEFERHLLHSRDYDLHGLEVSLPPTDTLIEQMLAALSGAENELTPAIFWNGGFYLWQCGAATSVQEGIILTQELLRSGQAMAKLEALRRTLFALTDPHRSTVMAER